MPVPGNVVVNDFSGNAFVFSSTPIVNNAAALVFFIDQRFGKSITSVSYSLSLNPFVAGGILKSAIAADAPLNTEVFGRLTVFRNFSQNPAWLFDPFFDSAFTTAGPPFASDFYGPRVDYAKDESILDVVISKIHTPQTFDLHCARMQPDDKLCVVLSPFYHAVANGGAVKNFGEYAGDELMRTLNISGCLDTSAIS